MSAVDAVRAGLRGLLGIFFIAAGVNHFVSPAIYRGMMPPGLPWPDASIAISGFAEIVGGVGLLWPRAWPPVWARRAAGWGLIALLVAIFPANVHVALAGEMPGTTFSPATLWARLPFQGVFIAAVWWTACRSRTSGGRPAESAN